MRNLHRIILYAIVITLSATSCQHKELCYDHSHTIYANIEFDWTKSPEADPKTMSLYLFDEDGTNPERYEFVNREGGRIRLMTGTYQAICLNSDTEVICHENTDNFSTYTITTDEVDILSGMSTQGIMKASAPRVKGTEDQKVISPLEKIWCHQMTNIEFTEDGANTLTLTPEKSYAHVKLEILNVENLLHTTAVSGAITGLADGYIIGLDKLSEGLATIPFELKVTGEKKDRLEGEFYTFGHCPNAMNKHILTIYVIMRDGSKWVYTVDVTDQMHNISSEIITIVIDQLPIPELDPDEPGEGGGGFMPTVDDWNTINIGINM